MFKKNVHKNKLKITFAIRTFENVFEDNLMI